MNIIPLVIQGNLGCPEGPLSDGVLVGELGTNAVGSAVTAFQTATSSSAACYTDDGGLYTDDSVDFNDAGANDVEAVPAAPAVDDAIYFGSDNPFGRVDLNMGTAGVGDWTTAYEYWDGSTFSALSGVTDPSTGFTAGSTGINSLTFTTPGDWVANTVDGLLKYWIRLRISAFTSITTQALISQGFIVEDAAVESDETVDVNDADANDVPVTSSYPAIGDRLYLGFASKFPKVKLAVGTAAVGTLTFSWKYWDGAAWSALAVDDPTVDFSDGTGTYFVSFVPPGDWATTTIQSFEGYFIAIEVATVSGAITAPLLTQAWILPLAGGDGLDLPAGSGAVTITGASMHAGTASATNADSKLLVINVSTGAFDTITWSSGDATDSAAISLSLADGEALALAQVQEDGTTEFADATIYLIGPSA